MSVILITGAATGIGNHTARRLAADGHTVHASMRSPGGHDAGHARELLADAERQQWDIRVDELDVTSQSSVDAAVAAVLDAGEGLDVIVHNAGHLAIGYVEAFTPEALLHLVDVNAVGAHRVNRAVLPHLRARGAGTLVYVGSTIGVTTPPFLGPYVAAKAAFDALAVTTSYEVNPFGIETSIVMPGVILDGTEHFPNATHADDPAVTATYTRLDPLVARNEQATIGLFPPGTQAGPHGVAEEISRILGLPFGAKPFRSVVDHTESGVDLVSELVDRTREDFVKRMGYSELLQAVRG